MAESSATKEPRVRCLKEAYGDHASPDQDRVTEERRFRRDAVAANGPKDEGCANAQQDGGAQRRGQETSNIIFRSRWQRDVVTEASDSPADVADCKKQGERTEIGGGVHAGEEGRRQQDQNLTGARSDRDGTGAL